MKSTLVLYQSSLTDMINKINWVRATGRYVIRDPNNKDLLLYLEEKHYNKLVISAISTDLRLDVIATPDDNLSSVKERLSVKSDKTDSTPPLDDWISKSSKMLSLISGWTVKGSMIRFERNFEKFIPIYYRDITSWLGLPSNRFGLKEVWKLSNSMNIVFKTRGINQIILIYKIYSIVILQYIAGTPLKSTQDLGQRVKLVNGLPTRLPPYFRTFIRNRNWPRIRVLNTLFSSYKGFEGKYGLPDFSTITAPKYEFKPAKGSGFDSLFNEVLLNPKLRNSLPWTMDFMGDSSELDKSIRSFWTNFNPSRLKPTLTIDPERVPMPMTAGPNEKISFLGAHWDALAILVGNKARLGHYHRAVKEYCEMRSITYVETAYDYLNKTWRSLFKQITSKRFTYQIFKDSSIYKNRHSGIMGITPFPKPDNVPMTLEEITQYIVPYLSVGKLSVKLEAAGKIRIFAISDYWTQWMLKPLHESLFKVLSRHPCDATFDQLGKVEEFSRRDYSFIASYDLKSATDLIPIQLYEKVLAHWTSYNVAREWVRLLTDRDYEFSHFNKKEGGLVFETHRYTRGQPMGTLSSWAGLAMVHHFLVYLAASRVDINQFKDYLVLGDDIVIANRTVAESYKRVCDDYGITIGLPKSFISSSGFFQFASQNMVKDINISPISLKESLAASGLSYYFGPNFNLAARVEFTKRLIGKRFICKTNLLNLVRSNSTYSQWIRYSRSLTKGIFPMEISNILVSLLSKDITILGNNISINEFIASIRGDIRLFTKNLVYTPSEQREYLLLIYKYIKIDIDSSFKRLQQSFVEHPLQHSCDMISDMFTDSVMNSNSNTFMDYASISRDLKRVYTQLEALLTEEQWSILYQEEAGQILLDNSLLKELFIIKGRIDRISTKVELVKASTDSLNTRLPYLVKFQLSLLNQFEFKSNRGKGLIDT